MPSEPFKSEILQLADGSGMYWEICGNPKGKPALYLHGGPGSGLRPGYREHFDPERFLIVALDQRGCGRSRPLVTDPGYDLRSNTTGALLADIEQLREHLEIERWLVTGMSWGTTLALAYAQAYPEREIALAAVTTTSRAEMTWITETIGCFFPEAWTAFEQTGDRRTGESVIDAYYRLIRDPDRKTGEHAAETWCKWEDVYVVDPRRDTLSVIDAAINQVIDNAIYSGEAPIQLALSPKGKTLYISNEIITGTLTPIHLADLTPGPTITGIGANPIGLAITPNGKEIYVAAWSSGKIYVFDVATGKILAPIPVRSGPTDVVFTPNGRTAYVATEDDSSVSVIDVANGVVEGTPIPVGSLPVGINITPDGKTVYTINATSVSAIDTNSNTVIRTIDLSTLTTGTGAFV